jgi:hypothetical protein
LDTKDIYEVRHIKMQNKLLGCVSYNNILITRDGWNSYEKFDIDTTNTYIYSNPFFINDSILYCVVQKYYYGTFVLKLNINTKEYEFYFIDKIRGYLEFLCVVNENLLFVCGKSNTISGGSGHDAIYKSTDGGNNWRRVLDLYSSSNKFNNHDIPEFGLQSIAFKDSLSGIAVGQFGKILYTYDGGESWIYESKLPVEISEKTPPTMLVRYAGSIPIIADFTAFFHRMTEDNLAPKPEDTLSISGRVWEGGKGQPNIPVVMGYRVTMTDADGYYKFTHLKQGSYTVKAMNKYYDGGNTLYDYKPFDYSPLQYDIELSHDTTSFDFNASDLRTYHTISGYVVDTDGKGIADIDVRFARSVITYDGLGLADTITTTDSTGKFEFHNIESYKTWDITPVHDNFKFSPLKHTVRLFNGDTTDLKFTGTPTTSVWESGKDKGIVVSPNPAGDYIVISIPEIKPTVNRRVDELVDKIRIFNTLGIDLTPDLSINGEEVRIDVSHLPAGVYFVKIDGMVEKFVKM